MGRVREENLKRKKKKKKRNLEETPSLETPQRARAWPSSKGMAVFLVFFCCPNCCSDNNPTTPKNISSFLLVVLLGRERERGNGLRFGIQRKKTSFFFGLVCV